MDPEKLVKMANQIAANFDCGEDKAKAVAGVADHLKRFWAPIMLAEMAAYMSEDRGELDEIAREAMIQVLSADQAD